LLFLQNNVLYTSPLWRVTTVIRRSVTFSDQQKTSEASIFCWFLSAPAFVSEFLSQLEKKCENVLI
jgi:hypothetical protein